MSFVDMADLAEHAGFQRRVRVAMVKTAVAVGSDVDDPNNLEISRVKRAHSVAILTDQEKWAERYAWAVATNPVIVLGSSDNDIEFSINSRFAAMAGAPPVPAP